MFRDTPQPLIRVPLQANVDFFASVFEKEEDPQLRANLHCAMFEVERLRLEAICVVESLIMDPCAMLNGIIAYIGQRSHSMMTERKGYTQCQFCFETSAAFVENVFVPFLCIIHFQHQAEDRPESLCFTTNSAFLLQNTCFSAYNQMV